MKQPEEIAKELIEKGKLKRMECGMLDVHIDILTEYSQKYEIEKYVLLDAILEYEHTYLERCRFN
tara:strand:- start:2021 stop:2215 length:195 start_codon:yes stop_codon:yes gene_type:complete